MDAQERLQDKVPQVINYSPADCYYLLLLPLRLGLSRRFIDRWYSSTIFVSLCFSETTDFSLGPHESLPQPLIEENPYARLSEPPLRKMHPPLTLHRHPMCAEIIEQFQKCHVDHPIGKFFGECTDLKIKLDRCFRQEKSVKRKANFEESKKLKERLRAYKKETDEVQNRDVLKLKRGFFIAGLCTSFEEGRFLSS
ncbi:hypothetical protein DM860_001237 [Cuscuta australis]|uniref:COX assembly mitochondrial protein n=1 Tax=Cuscuta australis TaxID=267555 RepID=A0A328DT61_9ASTE|nr:hypothetical protein DM860_001237 [Cuscuta australis]